MKNGSWVQSAYLVAASAVVPFLIFRCHMDLTNYYDSVLLNINQSFSVVSLPCLPCNPHFWYQNTRSFHVFQSLDRVLYSTCHQVFNLKWSATLLRKHWRHLIINLSSVGILLSNNETL